MEWVFAGNVLRLLIENPKATGLVAILVAALATYLLWLSFNKLLDRRDRERQGILDQAAAQHKELMEVVRSYQSLLERQSNSASAQNQAALAKLDVHVDASVAAFQMTGKYVRDLDAKVDRVLDMQEANAEAAAAAHSDLADKSDAIHTVVNIIRGASGAT